MTSPTEERRRVPRIPVRQGHVFLKSTWSTVQLLDISLSGVLLSSSTLFDVKRRGELRVVLGGEPVAVQVEVRRQDPADSPGQGTVRAAAQFVAMSENSRRSLEKFLRYRVSAQ
jgi:hypothetical protein